MGQGQTETDELVAGIRLFLRKVGAQRGILFGSGAEGPDTSSSGVDLVVISEAFADVPFPERLVFLQRNWDLPYFLEALPYTEEELTRLAVTRGTVRAAVQTGKEILPAS